MMKRTLLLVLTAVFLISGSTASFAQDDVEVAAVVKITPVRGHEETLITAITDYHKWVAQFEGHHQYTWYEVLTGPDTGKYIARTGSHGWADFDAEYDWQEKANEVFMTNIRPHVESAQRMMTTSMNTVTLSAIRVNGPFARTSLMTAMVDGGESASRIVAPSIAVATRVATDHSAAKGR